MPVDRDVMELLGKAAVPFAVTLTKADLLKARELDALREAGSDQAAFTAALTRIAASIAERPHERTGIVPSSGPAVELRAAGEISRALEEAAGVVAKAAESLGLSRQALYRKMEKHGLAVERRLRG